jgi:hypothetical protein
VDGFKKGLRLGTKALKNQLVNQKLDSKKEMKHGTLDH